MAKSNPTNRVLNRSLERSDQLVYVVDRQGLISFANAATQHWTGMSLAELSAQPFPFDSGKSPGSPGAGLCPPPQASASTSATPFQIWRPVTGGLEFVNAWAFGLQQGDAELGTLVVADPTNPAAQPIQDAADGDAAGLHAALIQLRHRLQESLDVESLLGPSPWAQRLRRQAQWIADSQTDVLILGAPGSGKEHLLRGLASKQEIPDQALVPIHGTIADPPLIQQAVSDARDEATNLVLMLLDVDRLAPDAQAELLGFLELPGIKWRTLATSTTQLGELVEDDRFSERLAHRLGTMTIELPPLRERREDIPWLAQAILERHRGRTATQLGGLSDATIDLLTEFDWPENFNQLVDTIAGATARAQGPLIQPRDLPETFHRALEAMRVGNSQVVSLDLTDYLAEIESELLQRALRQARGNKTQAARQLNISRPRLLRRLQALGLEEFLAASQSPDEIRMLM